MMGGGGKRPSSARRGMMKRRGQGTHDQRQIYQGKSTPLTDLIHEKWI